MSNGSNGSVTTNQLSCLIVGALTGIHTLFTPNLFVKAGRQDAWICTIFGGVYPVCIVFAANFMCRRFPNDNILKLSKKFLGKLLGNIFNVIFLTQLYFYSAIRCAQVSNIVRLFTNYFLTQKLVILLIVLAIVYSTYKGITVFARASEVIFYFSIIMFLVPIGVFTRGDPRNLLPVFDVSLAGIAMGSIRAGYNYFGIECIFLFYPFLKNKTELLKAGLKASFIGICIVTWFTFASIYYFGIDIMPKYSWVVVETTKAFRMMTIKNFTFIFIFFWTILSLRNISVSYFSSALILNELWARFNIEKYVICLAPLVFYIAIKLGGETEIRTLMATVLPAYTIFNIIYITIITILILIKEQKKI